MAGDTLPTTSRTRVTEAGGVAPDATGPGGDLMLRDAVLLDFRQGQEPRQPGVRSPLGFSRAPFVPGEHLALTRGPTFRNNVLFWLLEEPRAG